MFLKTPLCIPPQFPPTTARCGEIQGHLHLEFPGIFTLPVPLISNHTHRALLVPFLQLGNSRYTTETRFAIFVRILANLQTFFFFFLLWWLPRSPVLKLF